MNKKRDQKKNDDNEVCGTLNQELTTFSSYSEITKSSMPLPLGVMLMAVLGPIPIGELLMCVLHL